MWLLLIVDLYEVGFIQLFPQYLCLNVSGNKQGDKTHAPPKNIPAWKK